MTHRIWLLAIALSLSLTGCSGGAEPDTQKTGAPQAAAAKPRVYIVSPANGDVVASPVTVRFGIEDFQVAPAGTFEPDSGHHHLLVDTDLPPLGQPIPADENHLHFGKAQTETMLELEPGTHTLQLLLGDGAHVPHDPPLISERITITVE
jgi:hypothetical protein